MKTIYYIIGIIGIIIFGIGCGGNGGRYYYIHSANESGIPLRKIEINVDGDFGMGDRIEIQKGIDQWNYALNGYVQLKVIDWDFKMGGISIQEGVDDGKWFILKIDGNNPIKEADGKGSQIIAFVNKIGGNKIYMIRERMGNDDVKNIMMHEIGHALGAPHSGGHLMNPMYKAEKYSCIDWETIYWVAEWQHLDIKNLNYCIY